MTIQIAAIGYVDGTPVVDIKPVLRDFLPKGDVREPAWAEELMRNYWTE